MKRIPAGVIGLLLLMGGWQGPRVLSNIVKSGPLTLELSEGLATESHPKMRQAVAALAAAKAELEQADNDFGGYKKDAIQSVDHAMKQLRLALQFDRR